MPVASACCPKLVKVSGVSAGAEVSGREREGAGGGGRRGDLQILVELGA